MLSNLFFRTPRLTALCLGLIIVAGLTAFMSLPRQEDPALSRRNGVITAFYPGAGAERVESMVTMKIENELQQLYEIKNIESTSRTGVSVLSIELADRYTEADVDEIWSKVRDRLGDASSQLPPGALPPELSEKTTLAATMITALVWELDDSPQLDILTRLADELDQRFRNLPGTRETEIYGGAREEIRVTVDSQMLASLGLTPARVSSAIARADSKVAAGQLRHRNNDILIEVAGALDSVERIRRVPLIESPDGRVVHVRDIARVEKTVQDPPSSLALISGQRGVAVAATMQTNRRVDTWAGHAKQMLAEFETEIPRGIRVQTIFDQSLYTDERLSNLASNLLLGSAIVVGILFFMMGARSALVVGLALPLTIALVLAQLNFFGIPLHQTSVTGLIVALGLLIDNAIVVVDDYRALLREGQKPALAIARTIRHLFVPLAASTLTTALSFLPIALMPGPGGEFVGPIAIGVILSVSTSFAIAMTLIPALAGYVMKSEAPSASRSWWRDGWSNDRLTAIYRRTLGITLRKPIVGVAISIALPLAGFAVSRGMTEQFFPPNDRNQFQLQLDLPSQTSIEETERNVQRARAILHEHEEVVESQWFMGEAAPRVFYNMMSNQDGVSSYAGAYVTTRSPDATERLLPVLQREISDAFPNARVLALPFEQGPPFAAPIEVRVTGPDLEVLRRMGEDLRSVMTQTDAVTYTSATLSGGRPKLSLVADADEARIAGLDLVDIAEQLETSLEGVSGGSVIEASEEIPVRVRVEGGLRSQLNEIVSTELIPTATPRRSGALMGVPLKALGHMELVPDVAGIPRRNGERTNTVQGYLVPYTLIATSLQDFRSRLDESGFELPAGYRISFGGESEQRGEAVSNLMVYALPLLVIMLGTIILSFNSFRFAGIIVTVGGLSVGLALLGVWAFGHPMGFLAVVGIMGLVGLAINGAIVVLSALRADEAAMSGDLEATQAVVVAATRHILGTTLTTVGGFLPLILFGGRFWPPMATAIAGGVGGSAILSLFLVPSLFVWVVGHKAAAHHAGSTTRRKTQPIELGSVEAVAG
jgi:multidrug efflux pump subunit AcrB